MAGTKYIHTAESKQTTILASSTVFPPHAETTSSNIPLPTDRNITLLIWNRLWNIKGLHVNMNEFLLEKSLSEGFKKCKIPLPRGGGLEGHFPLSIFLVPNGLKIDFRH